MGARVNEIVRPSAWQLFLAEMIGTALLMFLGLSSVILMFGQDNPIEKLVPSIVVRRAMNGFLFGSVGALIALSPLGKISGAHVNPVVTMGFWLMGKMRRRPAVGYVLAQFVGALLGSIPLVLWGPLGRSINFAATVPGNGYTTLTVLLGEVLTTFCLVTALCIFLAFHRLRRYTPLMIPILFAIMVPLEASISGISVNPARSFGPSVISGVWKGWWIYWIGPLLGSLLAILFCNSFAKRIETAKLYHFDSDPSGLLTRIQNPI